MVGKEDGESQFFFSIQVQAARIFQASKDVVEVERQQRINDNKATALANKQRKEREKIKRIKQAAEKRVVRAAEMQV